MITRSLRAIRVLMAVLLITGVGLVGCSDETTTAPEATPPSNSTSWDTVIGSLQQQYGSDPLWSELEPMLTEHLPKLSKRPFAEGTRLFLAFQRTTIEVVPPFPPPILTIMINYEGFGTLLGSHTGSSLSSVDVTVVPNVQTGTSHFIAANGDEMICPYSGIAMPGATPVDVNFEGDFTVSGGTGRFDGASGFGGYVGSADQSIGEGRILWYGLVQLDD